MPGQQNGELTLFPAIIGKIVLVLLGLAACWLDATVRKLPNWLSLLTALIGLGLAASSAGLSGLGSHSAHMLIALVIGMVLFRLGMVGGGDAKFYAGVAAWFSLPEALGLLLAVSLSGLVIFLLWFVGRRLARKPIRAPSGQADADKLPYGIAIAAGAIIQYVVV